MSKEIINLAPKALWQHFYEITQIPHPSKREEKVVAFVAGFGKRLGLHTETDKVGNVLIRKPASPGMETRKGVVLQGHLDMVPQKNTDTRHNFETDPIDATIDGDWVQANGTTLGADNGIGVAAAMAILEATDIAHPQIEALFTVDEETGMTGAFSIQPNWLTGDILINLDSEEEGELCVGCAGGLEGFFSGTYAEQTPMQGNTYRLSLTGLKGGHSGVDIALGRANANKLMARVLQRLTKKFGVELAALEGGTLRNAIPREAFATIVVAEAGLAQVKEEIAQLLLTICAEYEAVEDSLHLALEPAAAAQKVVEKQAQKTFIEVLLACPNGVVRMNDVLPGLVETSNNLAIVSIANGKFAASCLLRSSVDSAKEHLSEVLAATFALGGMQSRFAGNYPGWKPNANSPILAEMSALYEKMFAQKPHIRAIHAGLECGLLGKTYPHWDMISCGPTILHPHSPAERVQVSSVEKWWSFLLETLKNIPKK